MDRLIDRWSVAILSFPKFMIETLTMTALVPSLRIGITGARDLRPEQEARIRRDVDAFLAAVGEEIQRILDLAPARDVYGVPGSASPPAFLTAISPLAEGADRLFAQRAIAHGFSLTCPLPFTRDEYERDFKTQESKQEFRRLLSAGASSIIEIDGGRGDAETKSYEAVGRYVARNCDILVAIWNGQAGHGLGGTSDIVRFAANHGPPVWWIHAEKEVPSSWLIDGQDLRQTAENVIEPRSALRNYLSHLFLPPLSPHEMPPTVLKSLPHLCGRHGVLSHVMLAQRKTTSDHRIWQVHSWLMKMARRIDTNATSRPSQTTKEPASVFWLARYLPAVDIAGEFARRYRSSYVWTFVLAALALICAAIALVTPRFGLFNLAVTCTELISLLLIAALAVTNERQAWHRKFLQFQLLAELCRRQQVLVAFGWTLLGPSVTDKSSVFRRGVLLPQIRQDTDWVSWSFGVLQRLAPLPQGRFTPHRSEQMRLEILSDLIEGQLTYYRVRAERRQSIDKRLKQTGVWFFLTVIVIVVVKLMLVLVHANYEVILFLEWAAAVLLTLSAAFLGIRFYAELSASADQSRRMEGEMRAARDRLEQINLAEPLSSQALASEVYAVATTMLQDIEGWIQLIGTKTGGPDS